MAVSRPRRAAWATVVSLILHVLVLTGMVLGLRITPPPPEDRAMDVRLLPALEASSIPAPADDAPPRKAVLAPPRPRPAPAPSASAAGPPEAAAPAPTGAPKAPYGPSALQPSLSGRLGCDDPLTFHLTPEQRQTCANNLAALGRAAKPLDADMSDRKRADYDRKVRCFNSYTRGGVPPMNPAGGPTPDALPPPNQVLPYAGRNPGMGYVPSFKDCPIGDR